MKTHWKYLLAVVAAWALLAGSARAAELVLQGYSGSVGRGVAISRDGRWMALGGLDLWDARRGDLVRRIATSTRDDSWALTPLQFTPDGTLLLSQVRGNYGTTKYVSVRAVPSLREVRRLRFIEPPLFCDNNVVRAVLGRDLKEWSVRSGRLLSKRPLRGAPSAKMPVASLAFSANGKFVAFRGGGGGPSALVWDARSGRLLRRFEAGDANSGECAVSDDGRWLAVAQVYQYTSKLNIWDVKTGRLRRSLEGAGGKIRFTSDGRSLWAWAARGVALWSLSDGRQKRRIPGSNEGRYEPPGDAPTWFSDGRLWDVRSGRLKRTLPGGLGGASLLAWSPDGKYLAGGSVVQIQVWDVEAGALLALGGEASPSRLRWRDGQTVQAENSAQARVWRVGPRVLEEAGTFTTHFPPPEQGDFVAYNNDVFLSPDGSLLLSNGRYWDDLGTLYVWNTLSGAVERTLKVIEYPESFSVTRPNLSPVWLAGSERFLIWASHNQEAKVETWNARTGRRERIVTMDLPAGWPRTAASPLSEEPDGPLYLLAVSPDGEHAAGASTVPGPYGVGIWRLNDGKLLRVVPTHNKGRAAFSPDGRTLAIADSGRDAELWAWQEPTDKPLRPLAAGWAGDAPAWSPDGKRIALDTGFVSIYDSRSGELTARLGIGGTQYQSDAGDWIAWTPQGYYNASPRAEARFRWREGDVLLPRNSPRDRALRRKFRRSDLVARALGAGETLPQVLAKYLEGASGASKS